MANRYADIPGAAGDWWSVNSPRATPSTEQGGIAGPSAYPGAMPGQYPGVGGPSPITPGQYADPGPQGGDYQAWFNNLFANRPFNQETLLGLEPLLQHYGFKLTPPNAAGDRTKIQLPTGEWVRVGFGEGHPVWIPQTNAQGQSLFGASGGTGAGGYTGPGAIPPPFQAPSFSDLQQEPGFQARLAMGQQGLERSAAAQGSLLSGGFQKAFARYNQDFASNEYGNAYDRALRKYQENFLTQSQDPWNRYNQLYQGGLNAIGTSKTTPPLGG